MNRPIVLAASGLTKDFPGVRALDGVSFEVRQGEVHALAGANGAGKSTLMRILSGAERPDAGEILMHGRPVRFRSPHDALRAGVAMMHQELQPFPAMSVAENIAMGREPARGPLGWLDKAAMRRQARDLLKRLEAGIEPDRIMGTLTAAEMQTVEIAKALAWDSRVLIMDEPTSAISSREAEALFRIIGELAGRGVAVVYISHKMDEIFRLAARITVLRDGRRVATRPAAELNPESLIALMVGRELSAPQAGGQPPTGELALEVRELRQAGAFEGVSFSIRRGEILGMAGLMGAGRTAVGCALAGIEPASAGEIRVSGRPVRIRNPRDAIACGIAWVSEDRKGFGIVPRLGVKENITLASLRRFCYGPVIRRREEEQAAAAQAQALSIKTAGLDRPVQTLSGGNQQKVVLARGLLAEPQILILDEPTRGIDVAAKAEIHGLIRRLAGGGRAVLLISSETEELLALSHRILVMRQGRISGELEAQGAAAAQILRLAMPD
jgi:ABC-type sugar transport system ATPase subunit